MGFIKIRSLFFTILSAIFIGGCCFNYSLKGSSLSKEMKTVSVAYIKNEAAVSSPTLGQVLTEKLKNKFTTETSLKVVTTENADLQFSGKITNFIVTNAAQQSGSTTSTNRLSITVNMKCVNVKDSTQSYEQAFTNYSDFAATQQFSSVEQKLLNDVSDLLVQEIFNKAVINW